MIPQPKPKRVTDRAYLRWVKTKPCLVSHSLINVDMLPRDTCVGPIDPHHTKPVSLGGSDYMVVPLCRKHHDEAQCNSLTFQNFYAIIFDYEIERLNKEYKREHPLPKRERKIKPRGYAKRVVHRGWAVLTNKQWDGNEEFAAFGNGKQFQYPIFVSLREAQDWRKESPESRGKIVRVQIRIEGTR